MTMIQFIRFIPDSKHQIILKKRRKKQICRQVIIVLKLINKYLDLITELTNKIMFCITWSMNQKRKSQIKNVKTSSIIANSDG